MSRKITRERFDRIKNFLDTPVRVKPSIRYVAECFGYSSGTIAQINRFDNFKEYKKYQTERQNQYSRNYLENELNFQKSEAEANKKVFDDFNSEWFFGGENEHDCIME